MLAFFSLLLAATAGFAENLVIENKTSYPAKHQQSKIAIQWANSAKEVQENNHASLYGKTLNPATFQELTKSGTIQLNIPQHAEYFRILVWTKGEGEPDLLTNWVDIVPNKTYRVDNDRLVPAVLMAGTGC